MEELLRFIAASLVDNPESVEIVTKQDGEYTVLELHVAEGDMGKVIGRQGRIAKAIRTLVKAASAREDKKFMVEIV